MTQYTLFPVEIYGDGGPTAQVAVGPKPKPKASYPPEPLWLRLLNLIGNAPGISRSELSQAVRHTLRASAVGEALAILEQNDFAYRLIVSGAGRPAVCWHAGARPKG